MCKLLNFVLIGLIGGLVSVYADNEMVITKDYFGLKNQEDFKFIMNLQGQDEVAFSRAVSIAISLNQFTEFKVGEKVYLMDVGDTGIVLIRRKGELIQYYTASEIVQSE